MFKKLFYSSIFALTCNIIFKAISAIIVIIMANYLGPTKYGIYSTAIAFVSLFLVFSDFGLRILLVQEGSKDFSKTPLHFGNTLIFQIVFVCLVIPASYLIGKLVGYNQITLILILILTPALFLIEHARVSWALLRLKDYINIVSISEILQGAANLIAVLLVIKFADNKDFALIAISLCQLIVSFIYFASLLYLAVKKVCPPCFAVKQLPAMLKKSYLFALSELLVLIYFQVDQIVISIIKNAKDVGLYSAPLKVIVFFLLVPRILVRISRQLMYRLHYQNLDKYRRINLFFHRYYAGLGVGIGIIIFMLAEPIIYLLFKANYEASIPVLKVFGFFLISYFISVASSQSLTTLLKQKTLTKIQTLTVTLNLILDIILIYKFGIIGAAFATLSVQIISSVLSLYYDAKYMQEKISNFIKPLFSIAAAGLIMATSIYFLQNKINFLIIILISSIIYLACLYLFRFFNEYDLKLMKQIISKK